MPMTPEQMAGCFLDYQDHFSNHARKEIAANFLMAFLEKPRLTENEKIIEQEKRDAALSHGEARSPSVHDSDTPSFKNFVAMSSGDNGIMHKGYVQAAEAYQQANAEERVQVQALLNNITKKDELMKGAKSFLVDDFEAVQARANKQQADKDLQNKRWFPGEKEKLIALKEKYTDYASDIKMLEQIADLSKKSKFFDGEYLRLKAIVEEKNKTNPQYEKDLGELKKLIAKSISIGVEVEEPTAPVQSAPGAEPQTTPPQQSVPQAESKPAPQRTSEPQSSQTPPTFKKMFENVNFTNEYNDIKKLSIAQKLHLHDHLRAEQIQLLDMIEKSLLSDNKMSDTDHAQVFYSVLTLAQNNLKHEFRWTALLGFPRQSRLEDIIQKHLKALSTSFPDMQPLANKEQLKTLLVEKALTSIEQHIDKLLKPHGFLQAVKAFIKEGLLNMSQPPKGPTH